MVNKRLEVNNNTRIEITNSKKFLGIQMTDVLKWEKHIGQLQNQIVPYCYGLLRTNATLGIKALKSINFAYMQLKYGIISWGNSSLVKKVFTLQKRAVRNIVGARSTDTCKPIFKSLNILRFTSVYIMECTIFVKKKGASFTKKRETNDLDD